MTRRTALARARRGAAFLDTKYKTWRSKIRVDDLDMGMSYYVRGGCGCILAQIDAGRDGVGRYDARKGRLGISEKEAISLGFWSGSFWESGDEYEALTAAWKSVLADD